VNKLRKSLYAQVILAVILGAALGYFRPEWGAAMRPLGEGFIKLVKMLIGPIIFVTVVMGIARMGDMKKVGRVGGKGLLYFEVLTTIALAIGLAVANFARPGAGMNINPASLDAKAISAYTQGAHLTTVEFIMNIIPKDVADAFAKGDILQILVFSMLFGSALAFIKEDGIPVMRFLDGLNKVFFRIVAMVMRLAPIGAFGAMAFTVGKYGLHTLINLGRLVACFYLTSTLFVVLILGLVMRWAGLSIFKFLRFIREEILIVLGTSSSESALPLMMEKMERLGCSKSVVGMVIPMGYSFNLDGTSIYLTLAALFIAQATNTHVTLPQQLYILAILLLTSKAEVQTRHDKNPRSHMGFRGFSYSATVNAYSAGTPMRSRARA
jgi:aerobic C4-dicarboxylate transport protein